MSRFGEPGTRLNPMTSEANQEAAPQRSIIAEVISGRSDGMVIEELLAAYEEATGQAVTRRTIQRWLVELRAAGRVRTEGAARATRYFPTEAAASDAGPAAPEPDAGGGEDGPREEAYVPLSPEGEEVRALVRRPFAERPPVGYDPEFLERYEPGTTWYLPGALRERLQVIGRTPDGERPAGTYAREIYGQLLTDLSWASSRLEGNRYTRLDTQALLRYGIEATGTDLTETQMILNHRSAIELLVDQAEDVGFNRWTFLALHAALAENLVNDRRYEGALRTRIVRIVGTSYTPTGIPQKIEEHFDLLLAKAGAITDPFEQAFFVMVHLPYLQPFIDVNKRTSRLGANIPLIKANLSPLSFVGVPERAYVEGTLGVYELNRVELLRDVFVSAYERSAAEYKVVREAMGKPDPFRLAWREQLREVVRDAVQQRLLPEPGVLAEWADAHGIAPDVRDRFVDYARAELLELHDGSIHRYRLRPGEFHEWQAHVRGAA